MTFEERPAAGSASLSNVGFGVWLEQRKDRAMDIVEMLRESMRAGDLTNEAADEIEQLRNALRLVMSCAGCINGATDADLEAALECGDAETERQANAWLVARAALKTPNAEVMGGRQLYRLASSDCKERR